MISHYLNYVCLAQVSPYPASRTICYHNTLEIVKFDLEPEKKCLFCGDPNYVEPEKTETDEKKEGSNVDKQETDQKEN